MILIRYLQLPIFSNWKPQDGFTEEWPSPPKQKYTVVMDLTADAASEPEASEQVSNSNSYWALKVRFYFRFSDQNALLLTDQNASLLTDQNALHA